MTLSQFRDKLLLFLSETSTNTNLTAAEQNDLINDAIEVTAAVSESSVDSFEIAPQQGIGAYTLPSDNIVIQTAYFGDKSISNDLEPLEVYQQAVLKSVNPYWLDETTSSQGEPRRLLILDRNTIFLDPRPDAASAASGKKIVCWYVFVPTKMVQDNDTPNIALAFHRIVPLYAAGLTYLKLKNPEMAKAFYDRWLAEYNLIKGVTTRGAEEIFAFKFAHTEE